MQNYGYISFPRVPWFGHPWWLSALPDTFDDFWHDSTCERSQGQQLSIAGLFAWPSEHEECTLRHSVFEISENFSAFDKSHCRSKHLQWLWCYRQHWLHEPFSDKKGHWRQLKAFRQHFIWGEHSLSITSQWPSGDGSICAHGWTLWPLPWLQCDLYTNTLVILSWSRITVVSCSWMAVWIRGDRLHELGSCWSGSRSGFPLHKVCTFPAPGLRLGAKQRAQRVCDRRFNSTHLVSKVQRGVTSILGDRDAKDNQSQQETQCLKSLIVANRWQAWH